MRRWLLQVDCPEANNLTYSRTVLEAVALASQKNYWVLDGADYGTVLGHLHRRLHHGAYIADPCAARRTGMSPNGTKLT